MLGLLKVCQKESLEIAGARVHAGQTSQQCQRTEGTRSVPFRSVPLRPGGGLFCHANAEACFKAGPMREPCGTEGSVSGVVSPCMCGLVT